MSSRRLLWGLLLLGLFAASLVYATSREQASRQVAERAPGQAAEQISPADASQHFINLLTGEESAQVAAVDHLLQQWQPGYATMLLETSTLARDPLLYQLMVQLLQEKTGADINYDFQQWFDWVWQQDYRPHPDYVTFKSRLYGLLSPIFSGYFDSSRPTTIRLDEVRWGGVLQDGIPPLRSPTMLSADQADYLDDSNIVFGIEVNGDVRAYPKRILAWHEMFVDDVGGIPVAGVYCTLCGTVIIYETTFNGTQHQLGTSGFLYRSNKLMYDQATQSLWSTFEGTPVIGPLVGQGITLRHRSVVTTTWGEWKRRHPDTTVLSLNTGFDRDYGEGVAYQEYFATDDLMFNVPSLDQRLKNKAEILGLKFAAHPDQPLAISIEYLDRHPIYHGKIGDQSFVALTDSSGAVRVYDNNGLRFEQWDRDRLVVDENGVQWALAEATLTNAKGEQLPRLPANRAFWFGWYSSYTNTQLVH